LSARSVNPKLVIGIETIYNKEQFKSFGIFNTLKNYNNLHFNDLLSDNNNIYNYLQKLIIESSDLDIKNVILDNNKLKGGFIADVVSFNIITKTNNNHHLILKYENKDINNLSIMAKQLQLYDREYYFYNNISKYVNINIPKFYNLLLDENNNNCGIILENLFNKNYKNNINLNEVEIEVSLKIIDKMSQLHSKFWNKDLKTLYPKLKYSIDECFNPFFNNFINEKYDEFVNKWSCILNEKQLNYCSNIKNNFNKIQERLSKNNITFIHGDIKSPNIFYDISNNYDPYFIDWQHCAIGKGCQDLIFFIIESFDITKLHIIYPLFKNYYYMKLLENNINYLYEDYNNDIIDAICYVPYFTAIWFGTTPQEDLIDKNFPYFFINKLFYLIEMIKPNI